MERTWLLVLPVLRAVTISGRLSSASVPLFSKIPVRAFLFLLMLRITPTTPSDPPSSPSEFTIHTTGFQHCLPEPSLSNLRELETGIKWGSRSAAGREKLSNAIVKSVSRPYVSITHFFVSHTMGASGLCQEAHLYHGASGRLGESIRPAHTLFGDAEHR
jgi:hypothetical protein